MMGEAMMTLGAELKGVLLSPTLCTPFCSSTARCCWSETERGSSHFLDTRTHQELLKAAGLDLKFYPADRGPEKLLQTLTCQKNQQEILETGGHGRQSPPRVGAPASLSFPGRGRAACSAEGQQPFRHHSAWFLCCIRSQTCSNESNSCL